MPQMMPMYWLLIFLFSMILLISLTYMIYFFKLYFISNKKYHSSFSKNYWTWKW